MIMRIFILSSFCILCSVVYATKDTCTFMNCSHAPDNLIARFKQMKITKKKSQKKKSRSMRMYVESAAANRQLVLQSKELGPSDDVQYDNYIYMDFL